MCVCVLKSSQKRTLSWLCVRRGLLRREAVTIRRTLGCLDVFFLCVCELVEQTSSVIFPIRFEFRISILFLSRNDTSMDVCVHVCVML